MQNVDEAKKFVKDFLKNTFICFYSSAVDGTLCVEYRAAGGRHESTTVENMVARIKRFNAIFN